MRILHINKFYYLKGGSETYLFSIIDGLENLGHKVAVFSMDHPHNRKTRWNKYFLKTIDYKTERLTDKIRFGLKIIYSFEARKKIAKLLDAFQPNIVHLHLFQHQISASIIPEIKKRKIPIVYTVHDYKPVCPNYKMFQGGKVCEKCMSRRYYHCLLNRCTKNSYLKSFVNVCEMYFHKYKKYYEMIDLFITPSEFQRVKMIESGYPEGRITRIPNFVDDSKFVPNYKHKNYFLYFGRLSEEKGITTLLRAMQWVKNSKLVIAGNGPLRKEINKKIFSMKKYQIDMVGFKAGKDLQVLLSDAMFTVLPSEWYEPCGLSMLESFASGKPVIAGEIGGIPEYLTHGKEGLIFESGNAHSLAERINEMICNKEKVEEMGRNARSKVCRQYAKDKHIENICKVYEGLLQ